jgi:Ca-activated chloride channel family protein
VRYIPPEQSASRLLTAPIMHSTATVENASMDFRFAAAVAEFGMLLRESPHKGEASYRSALQLAHGACRPDLRGYRAEFVELVQIAANLAKARKSETSLPLNLAASSKTKFL